jgi:hypothetical protein
MSKKLLLTIALFATTLLSVSAWAAGGDCCDGGPCCVGEQPCC